MSQQWQIKLTSTKKIELQNKKNSKFNQVLSYISGNLAIPNSTPTSKSVPEGIQAKQKNNVQQDNMNSNLESASVVEDFDSIFQTDTLKSSARN